MYNWLKQILCMRHVWEYSNEQGDEDIFLVIECRRCGKVK